MNFKSGSPVTGFIFNAGHDFWLAGEWVLFEYGIVSWFLQTTLWRSGRLPPFVLLFFFFFLFFRFFS
jgi:hypothetical protein